MNEPAIIAETSEYFVINKPAGMSTEPPSTQPTLQQWLIDHGHIRVGEWEEADRYGIIHRLDTDTSGVLIWAKNRAAQQRLRTLWQGRQVHKTYLALVAGQTEEHGVIELEVIRDNKNDRQTISWLPTDKSRAAITRYGRVAVGNGGVDKVSLVTAEPVTGRTHQIRVHFKAIGHPLIGDKLYGERLSQEIARQLGADRQFLHALRLSIPSGNRTDTKNDYLTYTAPVPPDLRAVLAKAAIDYEAVTKTDPSFFA